MRLPCLILVCVLGLQACNSSDGAPSDPDAPSVDSASQSRDIQRSGNATVPDTSDLGLPTKQTREAGKLYPVDEAPQEPSLVAFRQNLFGAIQRRDADALLSALAPNIQLGFSGESGREAFATRYNLKADPKNSSIWRVMYEVLQGGGVWQSDGEGGRFFSAPYAFGTFNGEDAFTQSVITGAGVNVRAEPNTSSTILTQLSYQVVDLPTTSTRTAPPLRIGDYDYGWTEVKLGDGRRGWVSDKFIYSPIGYRVVIERVDARWTITNLASGD